MSDSDSRALDLLTLGEIRGIAEGRRLLDLALGDGSTAREARERLKVADAVVELWREIRQSSSDREGRAVAGYERLGEWAAGGDPDALVELLGLARFLVEHRVPKAGNLDAAMTAAVTAALDHAVEHFRPRPAKRPGRRSLAEARAVAQQVIDLRRYGIALLLRRLCTFTNARWPEFRPTSDCGVAHRLRRLRMFSNVPWPEIGPTTFVLTKEDAMKEAEAVERVAKLRCVSTKTVRRFMADSGLVFPPDD